MSHYRYGQQPCHVIELSSINYNIKFTDYSSQQVREIYP